MRKAVVFSTVAIIMIGLLGFTACTSGANQSVSFSQLISQADKYNGKTVMLEAFYFSGFEISAISESLGPSMSGVWRIVPAGKLVWVESGITEEIYNKLYSQTDTPSGYAERFGKLKITGNFETGGKYGHLDAYQYQINIDTAELLEWSPPPAATSSASSGNLQVKVTDLHDQPLGGAKVVSEEQPDGQLKVTGMTNENGIVTFNNIKAGDYRFYISRYDYIQTEMAVSVTSGKTASMTMKLAPD